MMEQIMRLRRRRSQLLAERKEIRRQFHHMIQVIKSHNGRVSLENTGYAALYRMLDMGSYVKREGQMDEEPEDSGLCDECGDELAIDDLLRCSCSDRVCEDCYFEWGHYAHDTNPENIIIRDLEE